LKKYHQFICPFKKTDQEKYKYSFQIWTLTPNGQLRQRNPNQLSCITPSFKRLTSILDGESNNIQYNLYIVF